ncbi:bifunctional DNA-formamidopyrimidine glycosylase/DNA-(apurinic or apyrimidinic site) lyase [Arsenicitalea aurantiaca]|uniref:Formamidopyrimidine-DNA glycosylase n=1 Tax=Arsenicitalea aurantiaca TaxID=1783274 RepID=A0A433X875_9HYPH|nr:bifunctional DNA-formamidopyrimidine glycosylase/DNA-(apurinic or apyrimidinic site) lyase [Arsenicitalea aurantiaca]RUT30250.1 bifunctional DNA-formamidopyrimidine glycosylase/DNA-(apurinic or apyrimidinic site) lyase [Arsenicitalea aurantiaca]
MPELPEVETVRRGLAPHVEGAEILSVALNRADLRFPFPPDFAARLAGRRIERIERRAKYLLFRLSGGLTWLGHLGMTGSFGFADRLLAEPTRYRPSAPAGRHEHVVVQLRHPREGRLALVYADPRRFGFMDLLEEDEKSPYLAGLGPEPLSNAFSAESLAERFAGRRGPVKAALLDQRVVAGLGNIYVCEALHRAHIRPDCAAGALVLKSGRAGARLDRLADGVRTVLVEAIEAGGSTLRDFRQADGGEGYFQHRFAVYDREGEPCPTPLCTGTVRRIVQSGRSSFFCPVCQKGP